MAILLAFSGGLDTSFCVPYLIEEFGDEVITATIDTGGLGAAAAESLAKRSATLGATAHYTIDARKKYFDEVLVYLIMGNVTREGYPLCVGPERIIQASELAALAQRLGVSAIAHGSTGAGNDQIRFDVALRVLAPNLSVITPIRDLGLARAQAQAYLNERSLPFPDRDTTYSVNSGLWGTTIGGRETGSSAGILPDEAWRTTTSPADAPDKHRDVVIGFDAGRPVALDGERMEGVQLVEQVAMIAGAHGVGRGFHTGDTILGIKGRIAFEAPAAAVLIEAHAVLEKTVLTKWQRHYKRMLGDAYGSLVHEAQYLDPVTRDIESFLESSQRHVTGSSTVRLFKGSALGIACESPYSLFRPDLANYGETNALWNGRDAEGFARIASVAPMLAHSTDTPDPVESR
jgi:argininosuccinate synthase